MVLRLPRVLSLALLACAGAGALTVPAQAADPSCRGLPVRTVNVSGPTQLRNALSSAVPGDRIVLADGVYAGRFTLAASGGPATRIELCGTRAAVLDGGSWTTGYGLSVLGSYVDLTGFTVQNSQKGVMLDGVSFSTVSGVEVRQIGDEGLHLRKASHDNTLSNLSVHDTGLREAGFGEGVYVGSATNNWCAMSSCGPDRSDRNAVLSSTFWANGAEAVDVKEGTVGTRVQGNSFDGTGSSALSWVDVKGNQALIVQNTGRVARRDGFLTEIAAPGWGVDNAFIGNVADVWANGYGVRVGAGNSVACSNTATHAAGGRSNVVCVNLV